MCTAPQNHTRQLRAQTLADRLLLSSAKSAHMRPGGVHKLLNSLHLVPHYLSPTFWEEHACIKKTGRKYKTLSELVKSRVTSH